jgi:hypothetical protein
MRTHSNNTNEIYHTGVRIITATNQDKIDFVETCRADPKFFVENLCIAEDGKPYILEPHQTEYLRCDWSYKMLFWARRLSKSTTTRFDILHKLIFNPSLRALAVLPSWSQANDYGNEMQDLVLRSPHITPFFEKLNATTMRLVNHSRLNTASAGKEGIGQLGRGARFLLFDEAQQIQDRTFGFIIPVMRGTHGKKWQVMSGTPLGKVGQFWEVHQDARMYVLENSVQEVEDILEEEFDQKFIVFRRQTAYLDGAGEIISSGTKRIEIGELKADRKRMTEIEFLREYCLEWLDTIGEVFPKELVDAVMPLDMKMKLASDNEVVFGVDLGKQRNHSVLSVGERKNNGKLDIIYVKSWPLGTDYKVIADYLLETLPLKFPDIRKGVIDETGVGQKFVEDIKRDATYRVDGFNFAGGMKKQQLVEAGVLDLERDKVKIAYSSPLYHEMLSFKREVNEKTNRISYSKPAGGSDDYVDSLLLAMHANRSTIGAIGKFNVVSLGTNILNRFNPGIKQRGSSKLGNFPARGPKRGII